MSQLLSQLQNTIMYQIHAATYNPDAEAYAAQKKQEEAAAKEKVTDISGSDISGAKQDVSDADISGNMCFGTLIQLGPTNFFKSDIFDTYLKMAVKDSKKYQFKTLNAAKAECQKRTDVTGILQFPDGFYIYTDDATLIDKIDPKSTDAERIAAQKPTFIPVMTCAAMEAAAERATFSTKRLFNRTYEVVKKVLRIFFWIALAIFGSSLATNLNVYRDWPYRLLYAIYGAVFFFVVIPYVLLWRWAYQKKRPRFYALIPIIGAPFENRILAFLLNWFTFEPDDEIAMLDGCRF